MAHIKGPLKTPTHVGTRGSIRTRAQTVIRPRTSVFSLTASLIPVTVQANKSYSFGRMLSNAHARSVMGLPKGNPSSRSVNSAFSR